ADAGEPDTAREDGAPPAIRERVFVVDHDSNDVSVFVADPTSGQATPVPGSPFPVGDGPTDLSVTPDGHFLYVGHYGSEDIRGFRVGEAGELAALPGSPAPVPHVAHLMMARSGRALYAHTDDRELYGFTIDEAGGL